MVRRVSAKFDTSETMFEHERAAYERWLSHPTTILGLLESYFETDQRACMWGKLMFVGRKRTRS